jgi:hypothetical protein
MRGNEGVLPAERLVRESEIFRGPPGSGNYTSSIGAGVGIELFQERGRSQFERPSKTIVEPEREVPFEEAKMRRQFGSAYDDYVARVRRWL